MAMIPPRKNAAATDTGTATAEKPVLKGNAKGQPAGETTPGPAAETPAPAPETETSTAVAAAPAAGAVSTRVASKLRDVIADTFKDAFKVEWNTLHRVQANQGNFLDLEKNKESMGAEMVFELMSYQANWQISPGTDNPADVEYVRYSNDGVMTTQGEPCMEFLAQLKESNYTEAKMTERCTLAGTVQQAGHPLDGQLIQIDLPGTSKQMFDRYRMQVTLDVSRGLRTEDKVNPIRLRCKVQNRGNFSWTVVEFSYAV